MGCIKKYRKKSVVIEALLFERGQESWETAIEFVGEQNLENPDNYAEKGIPEDCLVIKTLEGDHTARPGDYIIKGVRGEFYPCKPHIFEETYKEEC